MDFMNLLIRANWFHIGWIVGGNAQYFDFKTTKIRKLAKKKHHDWDNNKKMNGKPKISRSVRPIWTS